MRSEKSLVLEFAYFQLPTSSFIPHSIFIKGVSKGFIILFCFWHIFAITMYALPLQATDPITVTLQNTFLPVVRPYVLLSSQWQQWNLFSPDPLREISAYRIEQKSGESWEAILAFSPEMIPLTRQADSLKLLRRLHDDGNAPALEGFLKHECITLNRAPGTIIRMTKISRTIPADIATEVTTSDSWKIFEHVSLEITCPTPAL